MIAILGLECIQVKKKIVRVMNGIRREGKRNFEDQRTGMHCAHYKSTYTLCSRLMIRISRLIHWYSRLILTISDF